MPDLLFEIGTEELPSWYVPQGRDALVEALARALDEAGLQRAALHGFATPRRLAVIAEGLAERSARRTERRRGPPESAAFDGSGQPTRAALGFAASVGVEPEDLVVEETERGRYLFASLEVGGQPARELLPPLLEAVASGLPAPRKMRWGEVAEPFVRPVAWLVALLGGEVLPVGAFGLSAGRATRGHRFLAPRPIPLESPADYLPSLRAAHVLADLDERDRATWRAACEAAAGAGLEPFDYAPLRAEVTNLVESPFGVLGAFDESYLELPDEVLTTVMIHHQRFFPLRDASGSLAPRFVSVSNNRVEDFEVVRRGYERVLAGRLYDARFFWEADRAKSLSQHAWGLSGIQYQRELGSMADKVARVAETAPRLAELLALPQASTSALEQALPIFRADLSTDMVFEFPELEGTMARIYAREEGLGEAVAQALEDGVRPKGPEGALPASTAGAVLAVADRLDKLIGFFAVGKRPSGSADPFGLRRDALAVARVLNAQGWPVEPGRLLAAAARSFGAGTVKVTAETLRELDDFMWDRVASLLAEEGLGVQLIRAATADRPPVITATRRAHLLRALAAEEGFAALLALYKRAANLAAAAPQHSRPEPRLFRDEPEASLFQALPGARRGVEELLARARRTLVPWDLGQSPSRSLTELQGPVAQVLSLKEPLDTFLDHVLVMVDDEALRGNRLALLREVRDTLRELGVLEQLEGV